jgi:hypothetical protein
MNLFLQNRYLVITVVALLCFLGAVLIPMQIVSHLLSEVAYALIIAVAISVGIEAASRRELESTVKAQLDKHAANLEGINSQLVKTVDQIGRDVYLAVFKRRIPDAILDEIELGILTTNFARTDHRAVLRLEVVSARQLNPKIPSARVVSVNDRSTYKVKNISHGPRTFEIRCLLNKAGSEELAKHTAVKKVNVSGNPFSIDDVEIEDTEKFQRYTYKVRDVPAGNTIEVETEFNYIRNLDDFEIWRSAIASDGMTLTIHLPREVKEWDVYSIHRVPVKTDTKSARFGVFELQHAVLPHQGMAIWWRCSDAQSPSELIPDEA